MWGTMYSGERSQWIETIPFGFGDDAITEWILKFSDSARMWKLSGLSVKRECLEGILLFEGDEVVSLYRCENSGWLYDCDLYKNPDNIERLMLIIVDNRNIKWFWYLVQLFVVKYSDVMRNKLKLVSIKFASNFRYSPWSSITNSLI